MPAVVAASALAVAPGAARADGDPASDVLLSQPQFLPADTGAPPRQETRLGTLLKAVARAGFPIRVAIIPSEYDLGSVGALWLKPRIYARFLGIELSEVYADPLLVVMPNGLGASWPGHSASSTYQLLAQVQVHRGGDLVDAAESAVQRLAAGAGIHLAPDTKIRGGGALFEIILAGAAALLAIGALMLAIRRRRPARPIATVRRPVRERGASAVRRRWAVPGFAALCCFAVGAPILIVTRLRDNGGTPNLPPQNPPLSWARGHRRAPNFRLTDQAGRPVSLAAYRGRSVILTFVDPLCRNLCPLAAHVLNQATSELPARRRPVIIAVSVDIYADSHADLEQDVGRWQLVPQWRWAVGTPRQLAAVWRRYEIGVSVADKRVAGTTVHFITHDEVAYVIDSHGYERALFAWPYWPQGVDHTLRLING